MLWLLKQFVSGLSKKNIVRETYDGFVISVREIILGFSVENIHKIIESMVKTKTLIMESKDPEQSTKLPVSYLLLKYTVKLLSSRQLHTREHYKRNSKVQRKLRHR